jgi:predicted alpha/beta-fold hydrolase
VAGCETLGPLFSARYNRDLASPFHPLLRNPHLLTIAGNFWPREIDGVRFPASRVEYAIDARTSVVAYEHQPAGAARGQIVFLHGLEGSADAGYIASFAQQALERGYGVHRLNMRTCGGTESLSETMYHSGLTSDPRFVCERLAARGLGPRFLVGFSLGANVALKLAGELGDSTLVSGVCAISAPIDLAACVRAIDKPANIIYARRFVSRLCDRVKRKSLLSPGMYQTAALAGVDSIWAFDDAFTAPLFGFGTAANYYATQSAADFLSAIRIPALVVTAQDDPLVPFAIYGHEAFERNSALTLLAPRHGGHLGFLSRARPRFWLDHICLDWLDGISQRTNP